MLSYYLVQDDPEVLGILFIKGLNTQVYIYQINDTLWYLSKNFSCTCKNFSFWTYFFTYTLISIIFKDGCSLYIVLLLTCRQQDFPYIEEWIQNWHMNILIEMSPPNTLQYLRLLDEIKSFTTDIIINVYKS